MLLSFLLNIVDGGNELYPYILTLLRNINGEKNVSTVSITVKYNVPISANENA